MVQMCSILILLVLVGSASTVCGFLKALFGNLGSSVRMAMSDSDGEAFVSNNTPPAAPVAAVSPVDDGLD